MRKILRRRFALRRVGCLLAASALAVGSLGQCPQSAAAPSASPASYSWDSAFNQRAPISSLNDFGLNVPNFRKQVGNDSDVLGAFNTIISRSTGTYTPGELQSISTGFHLDELNRWAYAGSSGGRFPPEIFKVVEEVVFGIRTRAIILAPNADAGRQISDLFVQYFGKAAILKGDDPYGPYGALSSIRSACWSYNNRGVHCRAFEPGSGSSAAPSLTTLARIAAAAYQVGSSGVPPDIDGYRYAVPPLVDNQVGFVGIAVKNGTQVVVAIRGTQLTFAAPAFKQETDWYTAVRHLLADASWLSLGTDASANGLTNLLGQHYALAKKLVDEIRSRNPSADVYLTGHSLGGAVAQMVGITTGLPAVAFDAPNSGVQYGQVTGTDASEVLANQQKKALNVNYRLLGDPFSLVGRPVGPVCTVFEQVPSIQPLDDHAIDLLEKALAIDTPVAPGTITSPLGFPRDRTCPTP